MKPISLNSWIQNNFPSKLMRAFSLLAIGAFSLLAIFTSSPFATNSSRTDRTGISKLKTKQ